MAGICDGLWIKSLIGGKDDGTINIDEDQTGLIGGKHNKSKKGIFGVCDNGASHVTFVRFDKNEAVIYHGDIVRVTRPTPHFEIRNGSVTVVGKAKNELSGDWTAEKET